MTRANRRRAVVALILVALALIVAVSILAVLLGADGRVSTGRMTPAPMSRSEAMLTLAAAHGGS